MHDGHLLASVISHPSTVPLHLFNTLLSSLTRRGHPHLSVRLFRHHLLPNRLPDAFSLSTLAAAAAAQADAISAASIHSLSLRFGHLSDPVLSNSLLLLYLRSGLPAHADCLFDEMPLRTASSYNTLISHSAARPAAAWDLVRRMLADGHVPDVFTLSAILPLCSSLRCGREIHAFGLRNTLCVPSDFHVGSCLVSMYFRASRVDLARHVFDGMERKNVVTWTAMISGYVENGMFHEALTGFREMWLKGRVVPNRVTLISVLSAVGALAGLAEVKMVHGYAVRMGVDGRASLYNALIDVYSKCGGLGYARCIFDDGSWCKDVISWSSMISGYGIHGMGEEAVTLFDEMCDHGIKPDSMIGLAVLSACCRAGLVAKGLEIYGILVKGHGVALTTEMCACMVDLLGRAGQLSRALDFIKSMSVAASPSVWGALLDASMMHKNEEMQDLACRSLLRLEEHNPLNLVSVSNLHASSGRWDIAEQVRIRMKERALKKLPGCSWVNANTIELPS